MGFSGASDLAVRLAWWCGLMTIALALLLSLQLLVLRVLLSVRQWRAASVRATWEPVLIESLENLHGSLPQIHRRDRLTLLTLWNYLHDSLRDELRNGSIRSPGWHGWMRPRGRWRDPVACAND